MKTQLLYLSLLSVSCAFISLTYTTHVHAKTLQVSSHVGTWQNKDEDGDGVPDELDAYPFDASKSDYELVKEEEFNNNHDLATIVPEKLPVKLFGRIQQANDQDYYKIKLKKDVAVTVLLSSLSHEFKPGMAVMDSSVVAIESWAPNFTAVGRYKRAIQVKPSESGTYYIVINDKEFRGEGAYDYQLNVFVDEDVDAIDDSVEPAFGLQGYTQDTDGDGVYDGTEFYVFNLDSAYAHDVDTDGIPNWLDDDSDNDGIKDVLEGALDLDKDGLGNFVDSDSDGNTVADSKDAGNAQRPVNHDKDELANFIDLDDDNDLILDINDPEPLTSAKNAEYGTINYLEISNIYYLLNSSQEIEGVILANQKHRVYGENLATGFLNFNIEGSAVPVNIAVNANGQDYVDFVMPRNATSISYSSANISTAPTALTFNKKFSPIIANQGVIESSANTEVILSGKNFSDDTLVYLNEVELTPLATSPTSLSFTVPTNAESGKLYLKNSYGKSNASKIAVYSETTLTIDDSLSFANSKVVASTFISGIEKTVDINNSVAVVPVSSNNATTITLYFGDEQKYYLNALYLGQADLQITPLFIAASTAWGLSGVNQTQQLAKLRALFTQALKLDEVIEFADYIIKNNNQLPKYKSKEFTTLKWAAADAITAHIKK
ncbi:MULTISPECIES: IPT/TIG domain-containing protein [Pseudoalteromonas]|uniref:IPT/TIG domain-containing protein n=1 Tax=Pseudoalteromonas arctica A 37-1-2 TaxID=1117313 RepID=A0A290S486_9GAMM|nr:MULTISPECIES: IPT/TIG domain-containing protein [Pseudoalteromonas]ATC86485.1 hypothetical protein PARC_a1935 [Pseudoalteromonas arctica A 37-1-2]MBH0001989.1 hypothetical protein [Pseudoalteromonas sp. SWYJZ12]